MKKIRAVIFDLDGTIADTIPLCLKAFKHAMEPYLHRELSTAEIMATFGPSEEGTMLQLVPDHYDESVADYLTFYEQFHDMCPKPFDGFIDLLDQLKARGIRLAMVTGKGKQSAKITFQKFGIKDYFEFIETGIPERPIKPEGMRRILHEYQGIENDEVIYIGDSPGDVKASREVGIPVIGAAWAESTDAKALEAVHPDKIFYTVEEFSKWLLSVV